MKRRIEIILQHGWGFDHSCFRGWMPHLRENPDCEFSIQTPDRGYFGPSIPVKPFSHDESLKVVVAHSFGLHLLPQAILRRADLLVIASSFNHFHYGNDLEHKRSERILQLMMKELKDSPRDCLDDFYNRCYAPLLKSQILLLRNPSPFDIDNREMLEDDLQMLNTSQLHLDSVAKIPNILIVHGTEDGIVPPVHAHELTEMLPNSSLVLFEGVGHSLPFTHVAPVWIAVRSALKSLPAVRV